MKKLILFITLIYTISTYPQTQQSQQTYKYFKPLIFLDSIQFQQQKIYHKHYYELIKTDSIQIEYVKLTKNDSIIQIYKYHTNNDSDWIKPIKNKLIQLNQQLITEKDKDHKKYINNYINWIKNRYNP